MTDEQVQEHYDEFFEEIFIELEDKEEGSPLGYTQPRIIKYTYKDFKIVDSKWMATCNKCNKRIHDKLSHKYLHKYGRIEEMNVCDNLGDHLVGNVYVKFASEENAERAVKELNDRWFNGRPVTAELSPVTDFREACCRQYEMGECTRGGFCNFMHLKPISRDLRRQLYGKNKKRSRSRSRSPHARKSRSRSHDRQNHHKDHKGRDRRRSRSRDRTGRF